MIHPSPLFPGVGDAVRTRGQSALAFGGRGRRTLLGPHPAYLRGPRDTFPAQPMRRSQSGAADDLGGAAPSHPPRPVPGLGPEQKVRPLPQSGGGALLPGEGVLGNPLPRFGLPQPLAWAELGVGLSPLRSGGGRGRATRAGLGGPGAPANLRPEGGVAACRGVGAHHLAKLALCICHSLPASTVPLANF